MRMLTRPLGYYAVLFLSGAHSFYTTTTTLITSSSSPRLTGLYLSNNPPQRSLIQLSLTTDTADSPPPPQGEVNALICGGGPAGLLAAIMLAQKLPKSQTIAVYDRLSPPPSPSDDTVWCDVAKFYLIGIGGRGQSALKEFGLWEEVQQFCNAVVGRKNWEPGDGPQDGTEKIFTEKDKKIVAEVLPRDKLVGVLYQHILENYQDRIVVEYGHEVRPLDFEYSNGSQVLVEISKCTDEFARVNPSSVVKVAAEEPMDVECDMENVVRVATDLLIAADGTVRTIATAIEKEDRQRLASMNFASRLFAGKPFRVKRYEDDNQRVYKTIPMKLPSEWRYDINYSARTAGSKVTFDALPANNEGDYCGALLLKKEDDIAKENVDPAELRRRLEEDLPQFNNLLSDQVVAQVAKKPVSYLPAFRYVEPRLHQGNRCLILGDSAHTVKPYFGLGANSALEDVKILGRILDRNNNDFTKSVLDFSHERAGEAKALVRISRELDRPGILGFFTFILPIIMDAIFQGLLPDVFEPNVISVLQRESYTFEQVGARKRLDRLGQTIIIAGGLLSLVSVTSFVASRFTLGEA